MHRIQVLHNHLDTSAKKKKKNNIKSVEELKCIGEMENREVNADFENPSKDVVKAVHKQSIFMYRFTRVTIKIAFKDPSAADERYGGSGDMAIIEGELLKPNTRSNCVVIFMHPTGIQNLLPMPVAMARAGIHVVTCASRYPNNDSCCIMEKVVIDLGACIRHMKEKFGYQYVVLAGWSGGGSLSSFYQAQAENPTIKYTPAGDEVDLSKAKLIPADALMIMAAHISRAKIFTEWIDPSVLDEQHPERRDRELDLFDPLNPNQPPYTKEFIARFRQAQIDRNRRITTWCKEQLKVVNDNYNNNNTKGWEMSKRDLAFVVHCTQADPRRLDITLDPNGRKPTTLKELAAENHSPVGLARFTTLRSWLSQWSYDESNADGPKSLSRVKVPILVLANESDHLVPLQHPYAMYEAISHENKELYLVKGATHYYFGQQRELAQAVEHCIWWLRKQELLEPQFIAL